MKKQPYLFRVEWFQLLRPGWRNWQTQRTQNPPTFGSWGFDSPSRHHFKLNIHAGLRVAHV